MPKGGKKKKKGGGGGKPAAASKKGSAKVTLFRPKAKNFGVGGDILPKTKSLGRSHRWPKYIRLQRQKKILLERLKIPPAVNVFSKTADKSFAKELFGLFMKYRPETSGEKKRRRRQAAEERAGLGTLAERQTWDKTQKESVKPLTTKFGLNHITKLIEEKKAKLVLIANNVDPLEIVLWLPTLCTKMDVPFVIVKTRARLGTIVHQRNATCLALTDVRPEDKKTLQTLTQKASEQFNRRMDDFKRDKGEGKLGPKAQARNKKLEDIRVRAAKLAARI